MSTRFDPREMTIRDLMALATELRDGDPDSAAYRRACDRLAMASWYLELSGVLWCLGLEEQPPGFQPEPEPPPRIRRAEVVEIPSR